MKVSLIKLLSKVINLIFKKNKSGEKEQVIQEVKINVFNKCLASVTYTFAVLVFLNAVFPKLQLSDWIFYMLEKLLNYMMP